MMLACLGGRGGRAFAALSVGRFLAARLHIPGNKTPDYVLWPEDFPPPLKGYPLCSRPFFFISSFPSFPSSRRLLLSVTVIHLHKKTFFASNRTIANLVLAWGWLGCPTSDARDAIIHSAFFFARAHSRERETSCAITHQPVCTTTSQPST